MTGAERGQWRRWAGLAASMTAAVVLGATGPAGATLAQGWAWQEQRTATPGLGTASGIPAGDLAAAWFGQPDKLTYLAAELQTDAGSLAGAVLELTIDPSAPNLRADAAQLRACAVVGAWEPGAPMAWDARPATVCDAASDGSYDAATAAFHFDLTPLAAALSAPDTRGISIEPAKEPSAPFQVVFKGADAVVLRLPEATPAAPAPAPAQAAGPTAPAPAPAAIPVPEPEPAALPDPVASSGSEAGPAMFLPSPAAPSPASTEPGGAEPVPLLPLAGAVAVAPASAAPAPASGRFGFEAVYAMLVALAAIPLVSRLLVAFRRGDGPR